MAVEVATLQFKADTRDLKNAEMRLKRLGAAANSAEHKVDDLGDELKEAGNQSDKSAKSFGKTATKLGAVAIAAGGAALAFAKMIEVAREFDVINASLITVTGSADAAARAFGNIQKFAATTPYDLQQVSNAFVKLKAFGLDPSDEALRSYGNTASAMGKDLEQMIEAVADATTGEFERLKEFGIKARQEGNQVSLTFRGTTKTVEKSSAEIQGYLLSLGQVEFAGAMEERAKTLDGALSNLGDAWDNLFLTVSRGDKGVVNDTVRWMSGVVEDVTDTIALANGSASLELRAESIDEQIADLSKYMQMNEHNVGARMRAEEKIRSLLLKRRLVEAEMHTASYYEAEDNARAEEERQQAAADEAERIANEKKDKAIKAAQSQFDTIMELNETEEEQIRRNYAERMAFIEGLAEQGLGDAFDVAKAKVEAEEWLNGEISRLSAERAEEEEEQRKESLRKFVEGKEKEREARLKALEQEQAELEENFEWLENHKKERDERERERAEEQKDIMLNFEDLLLEGKSEKTKAAVRLAANLADAEKRENAASIISNSYDAAMKAYSALAGIPLIGPALGAAAAATVLAAGVTYAAQSMQGRALGGQVRSGESYVVGERGPEILTMGNMRGNITPNTALGKGGDQVTNNQNVTINVAAPNGQVDKRSLQQVQQGVYRSITRANARNR